MEEDKVLSRSDILTVEDTVIEKVPVPEWGGIVYVKSLSGSARDNFEGSLVGKDEHGKRSVTYANIRAKLVVKAACDKFGTRLFQDSDIPEVTKKNSAALERVFQVAQRLSGLTSKDVEELGSDFKKRPERRFYFRLASHLGMTVAELLSRVSSKELTEWMAFYELEPFGYMASLHGDAITASVVAEVNRNKDAKSEPFTASDFLPKEEEEVKDKSVFKRMKEFFVNNSVPFSKT